MRLCGSSWCVIVSELWRKLLASATRQHVCDVSLSCLVWWETVAAEEGDALFRAVCLEEPGGLGLLGGSQHIWVATEPSRVSQRRSCRPGLHCSQAQAMVTFKNKITPLQYTPPIFPLSINSPSCLYLWNTKISSSVPALFLGWFIWFFIAVRL